MDIIDLSRFIGNFSTKKIMGFINSLPPEAWDEFTSRQKNFEAHATTKTLAGIFPDRSNFPSLQFNTYKYTDKFVEHCEEICNAFCAYYNSSYRVTTAVVVYMPPDSQVKLHTDTHPYFGLTHRVHWCLDAEYNKMDFLISGEKINMKKGDLLEINNRMPHEVLYSGKKPRYNLIIDFLEDQSVQYGAAWPLLSK